MEVLVGIQFNVLAKGNTLLGDNAAWEIINRYIAQPKRIERLRELHLDRLVEDLDDALIDTTLNIAAGG